MKKLENIPNKIRALVLHEVGKLTLDEIDNYKLKKDYVLVKLKYCGICSSDIERVFVNGTYHFPTMPGHEMSGEVVCVNDEDEGLLGKGVCVFPMLPCMRCDACKKGEYAQCDCYNYFGSRCDGGFSEYLLVPKWNLVFLDNVSYKVASLCEPAAVSLHAASLMKIKNGDKIAVSGSGTIGLLIGYFASKKGAKVSVVCRNQKKSSFIKKIGFDVLDINNFDSEEFDGVFEVVGSNDSINHAIKLVRTFGKVVLVGNPKEDVLLEKKVYWKILRKQLEIIGSWNSSYNDKNNDWKEVLKYMKKDGLFFERLITKEFLLEESDDAFNYLRFSDDLKFKVVFKIHE